MRSVCTHDRGQDSPILTELALMIWQKQEQLNSFNVTGPYSELTFDCEWR